MASLFKHNPHSKCRITSKFGPRNHPITGQPKIHNGIDIGAIASGKEGDPLYAVADGTVEISKVDGAGLKAGYGYYIKINHGSFKTLYAHLRGLNVKAGQKIKAGDIVAYMGNSGSSTAAHLHFGLEMSGGWIDPQPHLVGAAGTANPTLRKGSTDKNSVKTLQKLLNLSSIKPGLAVDGSFGPATETAVKAYQKANSLVIDGIVGSKTWNALTA